MTDRDVRFSPFAVLGDGIVLLCALAGLTLSFLSLYGDGALALSAVHRATPLDLCAAQAGSFLGLAVLFALAALCVWSLPRFRGAAAGGLAVLWGLLAFSRWEDAVRGAAVTARTIAAVFAQRVSWGRTFPYESGLTLAQEGSAARLFLTLALALIALALGWAVVRARRWWMAVVLTLPPLLPGLLADLYPDWPPFMALALCWCVMLLTDLCKWAASDRRGQLTLVMLPCVGLVLALITVVFPREGYTRPQWALEVNAGLSGTGNRLSDFFSRFDGPFHSAVTYVGAAEEADLASAGPLNYSGRTVLRVASDCPDRLYLRGSSLAVYEDGVWRPLPQGTYQEYLDQAGGDERSPLMFPWLAVVGGGLTGGPYTATVEDVGTAGLCVYTPYFLFPLQEEELEMLPVEDAYFARRQGRREYTMTFARFDSAQGLLPENFAPPDFAEYHNYVYAHYLDVPEELREPLLEACYRNGPYSSLDPVDAAQRIARILNTLCEYDPETPAAPEGEDPVLYFLNDSRRGYCMHFASAATLMLRSLGIPARYAGGFTAVPRPGRTVDVPDRAAHAWVEVWVDGFGWYPVEVTPAAAFQWYQEGELAPIDLPSGPVEGSEAPEDTPEPSQRPDAPSAAPSQGPREDGGAPEDGPGSSVLPVVLKALAAAAGTAALFWLVQFLPKRFRAWRLSAPDRNRAALDGYGYLRRMERWGGRVDERAVELAQKAKFSRHTLTQEELDELRSFVEVERERLCIILGPVERLVFRYFWGMPRRPRPGGRGKETKTPE